MFGHCASTSVTLHIRIPPVQEVVPGVLGVHLAKSTIGLCFLPPILGPRGFPLVPALAEDDASYRLEDSVEEAASPVPRLAPEPPPQEYQKNEKKKAEDGSYGHPPQG